MAGRRHSSEIRGRSSSHAEQSLTPEIPIIHNCGLAAFYFFDERTAGSLGHLAGPMTRVNHRGQEGVGGASIRFDGKIEAFKRSGMVKDNKETFQKHTDHVRIAIGHCRYSTSGDLDSWQPFADDDLITVHNGNLTMPYALMEFIPPDHQSHISSDTHALHLALQHANGETFVDRLKLVLPKVEGAFSLILADPQTQDLYLIRDPQGFRPLHYAPLKDGSGYLAASETFAFDKLADYTKITALKPGQCLKINQEGIEEIDLGFARKPLRQCLFELIYIGYPMSEIFKVHVAEFRIRSGQKLAEMDIANHFIPEVIVGVKESGALAAQGYMSTMVNHLFEESWRHPELRPQIRKQIDDLLTDSPLYRTKMDRTFIMPNGRRKAVAEKFAIDPRFVRGKKVTLIDDSVVHGTSALGLKEMLLEAGVTEIHLRSASPEVIDHCYYGVDYTGGELIAANRSEAEIADILGIASIHYLSLENARQIAYELGAVADGFCHACFSGEQPVHIDHRLLIQKEAGPT